MLKSRNKSIAVAKDSFMTTPNHRPVVEVTRGPVVESIHYGSIAVVDKQGRLVASYGDPNAVCNMRSSSKPFQALPLIEMGGDEHFDLSAREVAILCASHSGTDEHVRVVSGIQRKIGVKESDLMCGTHPLSHQPTIDAMRARGEELTPNRHNCSGKHTGMLAHARMRNLPIEDYLNPEHPVQVRIIQTFAEMCSMQPEEVLIGIDGCSAPTFAVPLRSAALAYARLCDPAGLETVRADSLHRIAAAMMANGDMVAGPDRWDTRIMELADGMIVSKGGAEGYQGIGLMPGALGPGSPALGITLKISDGDNGGRAVGTTTLEVLRQLGALSGDIYEQLKSHYGIRPVYNWRKIEVGEICPAFTLQRYA
jgi:L-asparaginase II